MRRNECAAGRRVESAPRGGKIPGRNAQLCGCQFRSAEFFGQPQERGVSVLGNRGHDAADRFFRGRRGRRAAVEGADEAGEEEAGVEAGGLLVHGRAKAALNGVVCPDSSLRC